MTGNIPGLLDSIAGFPHSQKRCPVNAVDYKIVRVPGDIVPLNCRYNC